MKYSLKEVILIALTAVLMVTVGYVSFIIAAVLPIPGSKFLMHSALLSFMFTFPLIHIRKIGTLSLISFVFAFIMSFISIFMGIAIFSAGLLTDGITLLLFKNYNSNKKILFSTAFYPAFSLLTSFFVTHYITGNKLYLMIDGNISLIILSIILYALGLIGSYGAIKVIPSRIL